MRGFIKIPKHLQLSLIISPIVISIVLIFLNIVSVNLLFKKYSLIKGKVSDIYEERLYERAGRYSHRYLNNLIIIINDTVKIKSRPDQSWEVIKSQKIGQEVEVLVSAFDLDEFENEKGEVSNYYPNIYKLVFINEKENGPNKRLTIHDNSDHSILLIFFSSSVFIILVSIYIFLCSMVSFIITEFTIGQRKEINWLPNWLKNHSGLDNT